MLLENKNSSETPSRNFWVAFFRFIRITFSGFTFPLLVIAVSGCGNGQTSTETLRLARLRFAAGDWDQAIMLSSKIPKDHSLWLEAQLLVGNTLMKQERFEEAIAVWIPLLDHPDAATEELNVCFFAGQCCREVGRLTEAEEYLRRSLQRFPENGAAHDHLAFLLSGSGRNWEAGKHFEILARSGEAKLSQLALLGDLERPVEQRSFFETWAQKANDDRVVKLGLAAHDFWDGKSIQARNALQDLARNFPELTDAQAMLGELQINAEQNEFTNWYQQLPADAFHHPGIWYVLGTYARKQGQLEIAADCLQRTISKSPSHRRAWYQLSQVLQALESDAAPPTASYAQLLLKTSEAIDNVLRTEGQEASEIRTLVSLLESGGRIWEACSWALIAAQRFPQESWATDFLEGHRSDLKDSLPLVVLTSTPVPLFVTHSNVDFAEMLTMLDSQEKAAPSRTASSGVHFSDQTEIGFLYRNSHDPKTPGARMFEQTGGGVAALDFDADGWTDLFFPQGGQWDGATQQFTRNQQELDTLYRNSRGSFSEVSAGSLPTDTGFGQGCSAGDYDNDGFQDLYVGNIGKNQLLTNMGDGTFSDDSTKLGSQLPESWTASTAIVDLDGDSNAELLDINYVEGDGIFIAICGGKACSPSVFDPAMDHIAVNRGDGTFEVVNGAQNSKGLGGVVLRLADGPAMSLFISNDQVANVLLTFNQRDESRQFNFSEQALQAGLAVNENGLSMGCMGIATADVTGNGLADIFVSNFKDEPNTLYIQDAPGFFVDRTRTTGLSAPGLPLVGWGTQFLDANLDGLPDLVVTNGHVDDYRDEGGQYEMPTSFYQNFGQTEFRELHSDTAGSFFKSQHLGRGLARFDYNRDGAMDFVISNMRSNASIVTNDSTERGHFINVQLRATGSQRDAIGANVSLTMAGHTTRTQLTAGDGYMASNERTLQFGLGAANRVDGLKIEWPSGGTSIIESPTVDATYLIVEGRRPASQLTEGKLTSAIVKFERSPEQ